MDNYKQINTELIAEVQKMRINNAALQREVVDLRSQRMDDHRLHLEQQERLVSLLTHNFRETLREVNPEINVFRLLENESSGSILSSRRRTLETGTSRGILADFRRSSSVHQHQSIVITSPARRSSGSRGSYESDFAPESTSQQEMVRRESSQGDQIIEEEEEEEDEDDVEKEDEDELTEELMETDEENEDKTTNLDLNSISMEQTLINEKSQLEEIEEDEEDAEESEEQDENTINTTKRNQRKSFTLDKNHRKHSSPLRDLTNCSIVRRFVVKVDSPKGPSVNTPSISTQRGNTSFHRQLKLENKSNLSPGKRSGLIRSSEEVSSLSLAEFNIENFGEAPSSTPFHSKIPTSRRSLHRESLVGKTKDSIGIGSSTLMVKSELNASRPKRSCTPTNLVEPNLRVKMRNEKLTKKSRGSRK